MAYLDEQSAVESKSGQPVHQSGPGLRRPTSLRTSGRKPEACPCTPVLAESRKAGLSQPQTGQGAGRRPAIESEREAVGTSSASAKRDAVDLDDAAISQILDFFRLLNRWDQEGSHANQVM
jgi:hypothetical protein